MSNMYGIYMLNDDIVPYGTTATLTSVPRLMQGKGLIVVTGVIGYPVEYSATSAHILTELGISKVMGITSTYDHRIIQGAGL